MNLTRLFRYNLALLLLVCLSAMAFAKPVEDVTVNGTVADTKGTPLPGVSISVKGSTAGTTTDNDGKFKITVPAKTVLHFAFIGFDAREMIANPTMYVTLQESVTSLSQVTVVSIGYGSARKNDLTGAINSVNANKFTKGVITSTEQVLQGRIAGLTVNRAGGDPTHGSSMRLRGGTSLTASSYPLVVVDGVLGADINTISPDDIESMDVLKDASATAIYGARGANGVIIVNTKKPATGRVKVDLSGYGSFGYTANSIDMLSANQWRKYVRDNNIGGAVDYGATTDWQDAISQNAFSQGYNLALSGGNEKSTYRASLNLMQNNGTIITSKLNRLNGKINVTQKAINDRLNIDLSLSSTYDKFKPIDYNALRYMYNVNPTMPIYDADGKYFEARGNLDYNNPVAQLEQLKNDNTTSRFLGVSKFDFQIVNGLKAVANLSYINNSFEGLYYAPTNSMTGQNDNGFGSQSGNKVNEKLMELYLNYDAKIAADHSINLVGGYSYFDSQNEFYGLSRRGFNSDTFGYYNLGSGQDYRVSDIYNGKTDWKLISFFGRASYNFKGKYMVSGTLRNDGSTKFGANNKWGLFPSGAVAWNMADEAFLKDVNWLNQLKLRAGYGLSGNQEGIAPYTSLALSGPLNGELYYDSASNSWKNAYGPIQNNNPDLKWETTAQLDIGVDFTLFNRITGTIDYYDKQTNDLLYTYRVPQPPYLYSTILANVGNLSNKGVELTLNASVYNTDKFKWNIDFNIAKNKQKITKLSNDAYTTEAVYSGLLVNRGFSNVYTQVIKEGYAPGTFWGPKFLGIDDSGKFMLEDLNGDGQITDADGQYLGDAQPDFTGGLGMNFSYKNFDAGFSMYGLFGQKLLNATGMSITDDNRLPSNNVPDGSLKDNITDQARFSSYWIQNGSFLRMQYLTLGYRFKTKPNSWLHNARVYVTGENLFLITKYDGADPEISLDGLSMPGIDNYITPQGGSNPGTYPKARTFSLGASLSF
ncbi:TonB-dependent receptor [Solitalea sp. MAHUQ-68]|uniref:TonB-dependent receptor n=1 Tax=Solitalea agri TaxID=2953739 RepID=A0A9X2F501_9SPHI|nr:TonB-dependent receptor [Solitalea agri]MCO4291993.1 TonB-dependent receptor [Solitalea agri]